MSEFVKFDERDRFTQVLFRSVALTFGLVFVVTSVIRWTRPELAAVLFVPIAAALFGTVRFQVEVQRKQYFLGVAWLAAAFVLLPLFGWGLVIAARVPYGATEAKFIALAPQAVIGPVLFKRAKRRFDACQEAN